MFDPSIASYFINPVHVALSRKTVSLINPATLDKVGVYGAPDGALIDRILTRVNAAQAGWAATDCKSRAKVLHRIADAIEHSDMTQVARLMTLETGKPYPESIGEIANIPAVFRYYAELARHDAGKIAGPMQPGSFQYQTYEPYGVSVHIVPYNFPLILGCWTIAASLAAGNGVVLKASPAGTLCTMEFMQYFSALPDDLIACLPGDGAVGKHLIDSKLTHAVAFTGSVSTGRAVAVAAAQQMKPAVIEAGGSDPCIISSNADIDVAAAGVVTAAFLQSGQVCTSTERVYVVEDVHDQFVAALVKRAQQLRIGNGLDVAEIGPLVSKPARDKVIALVSDAVRKGAKVALGGHIPPNMDKGWFFEPTILTEMNDDMTLLHEEVFGPVVSIIRVADFDEALRRANASDYGLGACIFTSDLDEAFRGVNELKAGMVWVNNPLVDNDALPFGGMKNSGLGRALGAQGLDAFRQPKMVVIDPRAREADWWYPYPDDWFYSPTGDKGRSHS
ncbi:Betaine aldehyde dehydrogenase (plasmid) [Pseudoseohaeicola sp. NH-UV-7]|uniref:aldehyde dehydrogenase family protein n=1 Tax=Sulfitobacter sp. TBRI5 TaxID=2989732 RepID=UPI003A71E8B8